jgi:hypothetical protein
MYVILSLGANPLGRHNNLKIPPHFTPLIGPIWMEERQNIKDM